MARALGCAGGCQCSEAGAAVASSPGPGLRGTQAGTVTPWPGHYRLLSDSDTAQARPGLSLRPS